MDIYSIFIDGNVKPGATEKNIIRQYLQQAGRIHQFQINSHIDKEGLSTIKTNQEFEK